MKNYISQENIKKGEPVIIKGNKVYSAKEKRFIDNGDGTITDKKTGLMWQQGDNGEDINWEDSQKYAKNLELAGHKDWRVPTIQELVEIVDYNKFDPAIDDIFKNSTSNYWSATTQFTNTNNAWDVYLYSGSTYSSSKAYSASCRARCVRQ